MKRRRSKASPSTAVESSYPFGARLPRLKPASRLVSRHSFGLLDVTVAATPPHGNVASLSVQPGAGNFAVGTTHPVRVLATYDNLPGYLVNATDQALFAFHFGTACQALRGQLPPFIGRSPVA